MLLDLEKFRPVRRGGVFLITIGVAGLLYYFEHLTDPRFRTFIVVGIGWHLITGLGIVLRKMWGYYLLKFYLYALLLAVPIGTYIAWQSLGYLRDNDIKEFFQRKALQL